MSVTSDGTPTPGFAAARPAARSQPPEAQTPGPASRPEQSQGIEAVQEIADTVKSMTDLDWDLLAILDSSPYPMGARAAGQRLKELGHETSEASVSRALVRLDNAGLTKKVSSRGRLVTRAGTRLAGSVGRGRRRSVKFAQALDIVSITQLLDLLHARRAMETESVHAAASNLATGDLERLRQLVQAQRSEPRQGPQIRSMDFHRALAELSGNPLLISLSEMVLSPHLDYLERSLDFIAISRGTIGESADDHEAILTALDAGDAERARTLMHDHLTRLITDVQAFAQNSHGIPFEAILELVQH